MGKMPTIVFHRGKLKSNKYKIMHPVHNHSYPLCTHELSFQNKSNPFSATIIAVIRLIKCCVSLVTGYRFSCE